MLFINSRGRQIYAVLQRPDKHNNNGHGLLLAPPLGNEQRRAQRPIRNLMQNLSRQGYTLMRFDWRGTANSSGNTDQINSLQPWVEDLEDAARQLSAQVNSVDIVAIRFGALIASLSPVASSTIRCRYYWDPIHTGAQWLAQMDTLQAGIVNDTYRFLRPRKKRQGKISEFSGIEINESLVNILKSVSLASNINTTSWNQSSHVIMPRFTHTKSFAELDCNCHTVDEYNDWTDPRSTTSDMKINKAASLLVDLLDEQPDSTTESCRSNNA